MYKFFNLFDSKIGKIFGIKDIFDFQKSAKVSAALLSHEREREQRSFLLIGSASGALFRLMERERERRSKILGAPNALPDPKTRLVR